MTDLQFQLNKDTYATNFEPVYLRQFKPKSIFQIPVILPFYIPVNGLNVTLYVDAISAATFTFSAVKYSEVGAAAGITPQGAEIVSTSRTRVEMIFVTEDERKWDTDEAPSEIFDFLVQRLNYFMISYLIFTKDTDVYKVSKEMFPGVLIFRKSYPPFWENTKDGILVLHAHVPGSTKETLNQDSQLRFIQLAHAIEQNLNPFILSEELLLNAERKLKNGFYRDAVIDSQSAIEVFLSTLFIQLLIAEGKPQGAAEAELEGLPFISMVKKQFHGRIGGQWDFSSSTSLPVSRWYHDLYLLRNKVVHAGVQPPKPIATRAIASAKELEKYIMSLIKAKRSQYPNFERFITLK